MCNLAPYIWELLPATQSPLLCPRPTLDVSLGRQPFLADLWLGPPTEKVSAPRFQTPKYISSLSLQGHHSNDTSTHGLHDPINVKRMPLSDEPGRRPIPGDHSVQSWVKDFHI